MTAAHVQVVRLDDAVLCQDCHLITNSDFQCSQCGSTALLVLARVLGQMPEETARVVEHNDTPHERTEQNVAFARKADMRPVQAATKSLEGGSRSAGVTDIGQVASARKAETPCPSPDRSVDLSHDPDAEMAVYTTPLAERESCEVLA